MNPDEILVEVQKGLRAYKAFAEAEKIISGLQNAAQVERETKARIEALRGEVASAETSLRTTLDDVTAAKNEAKEIRAKAKEKAEEIVAKAERDSAAKVKSAGDTLADIEGMVGAAEQRLAEITQACDEKAAELAANVTKLDAAKAQIAHILGQ